jgi:hypothetical protein
LISDIHSYDIFSTQIKLLSFKALTLPRQL